MQRLVVGVCDNPYDSFSIGGINRLKPFNMVNKYLWFKTSDGLPLYETGIIYANFSGATNFIINYTKSSDFGGFDCVPIQEFTNILTTNIYLKVGFIEGYIMFQTSLNLPFNVMFTSSDGIEFNALPLHGGVDLYGVTFTTPKIIKLSYN